MIDMTDPKKAALFHMLQCEGALKIQRDTGLRHSQGSVLKEVQKRYGVTSKRVAAAVDEMEYIRFCVEYGILVVNKPTDKGMILSAPPHDDLIAALKAIHPNSECEIEPREGLVEYDGELKNVTLTDLKFSNPPHDNVVAPDMQSDNVQVAIYVIWDGMILAREGEGGHRV